VLRLGALYQHSFRLDRHVRPLLRNLVSTTNESASFYRREGSKRVCLFREDSQQSIRDHIREGDMLALDKGAAGHVLTAFSAPLLDASERRRLMQRLPMASYGERDTETAAMSVPIFAPGSQLAGALALSGPLTRFTSDRVAIMAPALIAAGRELSMTLGSVWD
jgi:DNA-binding IclR family transcriptional regulator